MTRLLLVENNFWNKRTVLSGKLLESKAQFTIFIQGTREMLMPVILSN